MARSVRPDHRGHAPSNGGPTWRRVASLVKHQPFADDRGAPPRQKTITVMVLQDEFGGALAYALQNALHEPARIRVMRVGRQERDRDLALPLPISTVSAEAADAVARRCAGQDVIVVETHGLLEGARGALLRDLRRHAPCLVVEVDDEGQVVRASGPGGWSYSALTSTGGAAGRPYVVPGVLHAGTTPNR